MRFIYNMKQADFFIKNGCEILGCGTGNKGDCYVVFKDGTLFQKIFEVWKTREH